MRMLLQGIVGLALGLTLLGGGAAVAMAHGGQAGVPTATRAQASLPSSQACAQDQADNGTESAAENKGDTDQVQDSTSPDNGTEATKQADTDNIDLQCGDQIGPDTAASGVQTGMAPVTGQVHAQLNPLLTAKLSHVAESALAQQASPATSPSANQQSEPAGTESETNQGNDIAIDGVHCDQQGQDEGNNAGC